MRSLAARAAAVLLPRPRLVLHRRARPEQVRITGYRRLGEGGLPAGRGRNYRPWLTPRRRDGEIVAWVARPRISVKRRGFNIVSVPG